LLSDKSRAHNDKRGSTGCDALHAAGCEACINGGCLSASCVFEMSCVAWRSKIRTDGGRAGATTAALVRNGPSSSAAEAVTRCRLRDANSAAARLQHKVSSTKPATPDLARPSAIDGGGCNPRSHRSRGLECPASTTARRKLCHLRYEFTGARVSGCGTGHIHCGGQTGR
jgi:hypothetical protein